MDDLGDSRSKTNFAQNTFGDQERRIPMTASQFEKLRVSRDKELVTHVVHDEVGDIQEERGTSAQTEGQLTVYCVETFFGLTCNGGFQSVFYGEYGWILPFLSASLRRAELEHYAGVFDAAVAALFPNGIPSDEDEYEDYMDKLYESAEDPFEAHEDEFWTRNNEDKVEFRTKLHAYVLSNQQEFIST